MKDKKIIILSLIVGIIIIGIIMVILKNNHKNIGNNISNKTLEECEQYIFNINSYKATAEITVQSNKNTNKYLVKQEVDSNEFYQEIIEPENIKGVKIIYSNNKLTVENTELNLSKIFENYPYIEENVMFLTDFINLYQNNKEKTEIKEEDNIIIFTINTNNQYKKTEQLYLNKENGKPIKLIVQDNNKKDTIYILYNEIIINNL